MTTEESASRVMKFLGLVLTGALVIAVIGVMFSQHRGLVGATGLCIAVLLASFAIGSLLGFLFSVPRVSVAASTGDDKAGGEGRKPLLQTNTNLERISDWLTTMLVGVGLSQITNINTGLVAFRDAVADHAACIRGESCTLPIVAPMMLLFGLIGGFLFMYLYTRIELVGQFRKAEEGNLPTSVQAAVKAEVRQAQAAGADNLTLNMAAAAGEPLTASKSVEVMFGLLYQPDGYKRVINIGAQLSNTQATRNGNYWFYLAAAFGQQHAAAIAAGDEALATSARENALDAARRAVRIDPDYRARLWAIATPGGSDDDLASLREDADFARLVGDARR